MLEFIFFGIMGSFLFFNFFYDYFNSKSIPKMINFNIYERDVFVDYFLKLNEEIINISKKYDNKIKIIKSEIELLPNNEEFIEFKRLKENMLKEIENKKELEIFKYITKIKKIFPTLIVIKDIYFPVKNKEVIKYYSKLSKKEFESSNIIFVNEDSFRYIINEFYDTFNYKIKYFKNFFKVIYVKINYTFEEKEKYKLLDIKKIGE